MNTYKLKTIIPTLSSITYLEQFKNSDLIDANKFISSGDNEGLSIFLEKFFNKDLKNSFDKSFAIINLRMMCLGEEIKIKIKDKENIPTTIKINLKNILIQLLDNILTPIKEFKKEDLTIKFRLPTKLFFKDLIVYLLDTIESIEIKNSNFDYKVLSNLEKIKTIKRLKKDIISEIRQHVKDNQKKYTLVNLGSAESIIKNEISFNENSFFYFLKFIFKYNISNIYNKMYLTCKNLNLNFSDFNNLTPAETDMLIAIYKKNNSIK